MPIREFECQHCGHVFESLVLSKRDEAGLKCQKCGSKKLTGFFSVFGVAGADKKVTTGKSCSICSTHKCSTCG